MIKKICLLGATGTIGTNVLSLIENDPTKKLVAFSFNDNVLKAQNIIEKLKPCLVATPILAHAEYLKQKYPHLSVSTDICDVARYETDNPVVINAVVGSAGLRPTYETLKMSRDLLLANKESLVMAGPIIMELAQKNGCNIIPIDSEHAALAQIVSRKNKEEIKNLIITASGGSLYEYKGSLKDVKKEMALKHPNWQMGAKITIDSATLMNKGFEVIEAHYLFKVPLDNIKVVVHRQSIVHAMVEFVDHSLFYQASNPDMRYAIQYCLNYPFHYAHPMLPSLSYENLQLSFESLDEKRFPLVEIARQTCLKGGFYPVVLNASNEQAVDLFLRELITLDQIHLIITQSLAHTLAYSRDLAYNINNILIVDQLVKQEVESCFGRHC